MKKIYIVEDESSLRDVLKLLLTIEGYSVSTFATAQEFLERDINENPNLYIFDVMLPDGSGIELCENIQQGRESRGIPVIIMSAHAQLHHLGNHCKPDDIISKPFDIDNLLERIKKVLD
ncbi:response regulator transcription factor [Chryseobacterium terrae]|uniref:Response regulator transcription factor n=1 Tax=Chryseobacterium terrae TaxID=3163299 RepID=A0ABW8Y0K6_9FLAO